MKLQIKVDDDGNIVDSCFKTFGCGSAIASSSVATEWYVKEAFGSPAAAAAVIVGIVCTLCTAAALEHALCRKTTCARGVPPVVGEYILFSDDACVLLLARARTRACTLASYAPARTHAFPYRVKGKSMDDATSIKNSEIANHLNLPPVKLHCSMLAEDAIKAAVKDVKQKQKQK